jgi:DNA-binding transcriptional LysR family regulator
MEQAFGRRLARLGVAMEIASTEAIKQAVIGGMGVGFLSAHTISLERRLGSLAVLDVQGFPLVLDWYVVHRRDKRLPPVAVAFRRFLLDEGAARIEAITGVRPAVAARPRGRGAGRPAARRP